MYKILTDFYNLSTTTDFLTRARIKETIGRVNSILDERTPKYISERISWAMRSLSQVYQIDKPLYDNVISILNKFGYDIDTFGELANINDTPDLLYLSTLVNHFEGASGTSDKAIDYWRESLIENAPKEIIDCVLRKRSTSQDAVDWRPTETTPEDYYAL